MITEARSRYRQPDDITPMLLGAEGSPDDFSAVSDEQMLAMANSVFALGHDRKKKLDEVIRQNNNGDYMIPNANLGSYADFCDQANYKYLQKTYPWLHTGDGIGIDEDKAEESHGTLEKFLASIPHEDWESFLTDVAGMEDYYCLDDDLASNLEMEEQGRWMNEDGGPDLINSMVKNCDDAYEAYLLSKVTPDLIWEWSRDTDSYPESQGDGSVWMDMGKAGEDRENQEWFLEHIDDDVAGWLAIKKAFYEEVVSSGENNLRPKRVSDLFDLMLRELASEDEQVAHVYNRIDTPILWQMFQEAFPDERRETDDPYWFRWRPNYDQPYEWKAGYEPEYGSWHKGYIEALAYLRQAPWFIKLIGTWFDRPPEGHPEFKFEALTEAEGVDPDDPEVFMRHGGGLREESIYEDDKIIVMYPRDLETLNWHLRRMGYPEVEKSGWQMAWKGNDKDIFVVMAKEGDDFFGHHDKHDIAALVGDRDKLVGYNGTYHVDILNNLLADPRYGRSVKRMLMSYYRDQVARDSLYAPILLQLGGAAALKAAERRGDINLENFRVPLGIYYINRKKYKLAAQAFGRRPETVTPTGVWLVYDSVEDLLPVFKNERGAETVFANDHHDWFSYFWEKRNRPAVEDVVKFLSPAAIKHIREVLVNRRVWFPEGGPEGQGEYVLLTKKLLDGYDDDTIMEWIERPNDQDAEDGVFDDIREAIQTTGIRLLEQASVDAVYTGYIKAAVNAIDGIEHKWGTHPTKATKYGPSETFEVFVPWSSVKYWAQEYQENENTAYDGSLEDLALNQNRETADPDVDSMEASWDDIKKEHAADLMDDIFELQAPELEPLPEAPGQQTMPFLESDDEEARAQELMKQYGVDKPDYDLAAAEKKSDAAGETQFKKRQVAQAYLRKLRGESIDPDAPEAMGDKLLSGVPVEFEKQVKAILTDSIEENHYVVRDLQIKLIPSTEYTDEEIDASDGRLYNRYPPHLTLVVSYLPDPPQRWGVIHWVAQKLYAAATNIYRDYSVTDPQMLDGRVVGGDFTEDHVIFQCYLFHPRMDQPADVDDTVPF